MKYACDQGDLAADADYRDACQHAADNPTHEVKIVFAVTAES